MKRSMMQIYIKNSVEAVKFYIKAFDADLVCEYTNDDGSYMHCEIDINGQILAVSEASDVRIVGNTMQFCLQYGNDRIDDVKKSYEVLKEDAEILMPLGPGSYSQCMFGLIDKYSVNWCIFT